MKDPDGNYIPEGVYEEDEDGMVAKSEAKKKNSTEKKKEKKQASVSETLSFVFHSGTKTTLLFFIGAIGALGNGLVYPILAYLFSSSFSDIAAASNEGLDQVRDLAYMFMIVGVYALVMATIQTGCFESVAYTATHSLRLQWFGALLRQDAAYFDVNDVGGIASSVSPATNRYRRGIGRKFGEGIQFFTTGVGGIVYAMYASWRVALVVLSVTPFIAFSALAVMTLNQNKTKRSAHAYSKAGSVAYSTVSGIKTVLSLNAASTMLNKYYEATTEAMNIATSILLKQGFANGSMLGSFICLYAILCIYGSYLIYADLQETGCDPSAGVDGNDPCGSSGPDVFGAMLGVAFAAQGISQVGSFIECFAASRVAVYEAIQVISRKPGSPEKTIYHEPETKDGEEMTDKDDESTNDMNNSSRSFWSGDLETPQGKVKAILPEYEIDATSDQGLMPMDIEGRLSFENVNFSYPTRPGQQILDDFSIDIAPGKTIAFVGPR